MRQARIDPACAPSVAPTPRARRATLRRRMCNQRRSDAVCETSNVPTRYLPNQVRDSTRRILEFLATLRRVRQSDQQRTPVLHASSSPRESARALLPNVGRSSKRSGTETVRPARSSLPSRPSDALGSESASHHDPPPHRTAEPEAERDEERACALARGRRRSLRLPSRSRTR